MPFLLKANLLGKLCFWSGAGAGATASAVSSDILNLIATLKTEKASSQEIHQSKIAFPNQLLVCGHQDYCQITPIAELVTRFYTRFLTKDEPGVIGQLGTYFGNHGVSLESIVQTGFQGERAEIVVVTHDVREGDFRQALAEIQALEAIDSIPSILRVL